MPMKIWHTILKPIRDCAWAGLEYGLGRVHFFISVFYLCSICLYLSVLIQIEVNNQ